MAQVKKVFHPVEVELLKYPEDAAVRVTVLNKEGHVIGVAEEFLKDVMTRRGGSSKRPDMMKAQLRKLIGTDNSGNIVHVEAL